MIQAIETSYSGFRFRSRIEARWAVFFNTLGIPFEYEKEGYVLPSGNYLPDFWLPAQDCFVEIKGESPTNLEMEKVGDLVEATKKRAFIFFGGIEVPDFTQETAFAFNYYDGCSFDTGYYWCECPHCNRLDIQFNGRADRIPCKCPKTAHGDKGYNQDSHRLVFAYNAAKSERFDRWEGIL